MFQETLDTIVRIDNHIDRVQKLLNKVEVGIFLTEEAILSVSKAKITSKNRKTEIHQAIKTIFLLPDANAGREVCTLYQRLLKLRGAIGRNLKVIERERRSTVESIVINKNSGIDVRGLSFNPKRTSVQITMMYNGKSITRHLKKIDGAWWGVPVAGNDIIRGFVKYDIELSDDKEEKTDAVPDL